MAHFYRSSMALTVYDNSRCTRPVETCMLTLQPYLKLNLTYLPLTLSLAASRSRFLAFSTSSFWPRRYTLSLCMFSFGKRMWTPPHSSEISRIKWPLAPIIDTCHLCGISTVTSTMLTCKQIVTIYSNVQLSTGEVPTIFHLCRWLCINYQVCTCTYAAVQRWSDIQWT